MALTVRSNGSGPSNIIGAAWFNDYYNLLTGAMNDQPVTLDYRHGSSNSTPSLLLRGDGFNYLVRGLKSDNTTEAFHIDSNGAMSLAAGLTITGALAGVTTINASGAATVGSVAAGSGAISGGAISGTTGTFTGNITSNGDNVPYLVPNGTTAGRQIFLGTSTPTGANEGDIWIKA